MCLDVTFNLRWEAAGEATGTNPTMGPATVSGVVTDGSRNLNPNGPSLAFLVGES